MLVDLPEEFVRHMRELEARGATTSNEDFNAYDYSGGNYDDAWESGRVDGHVDIATEFLNIALFVQD